MNRRGVGGRAVVLVALLAGCSRGGKTEVGSGGARAAAAAATTAGATTVQLTGWCGEGWRTLEDGACLALPERFAGQPSLVVFAHGMIAPDALPIEEQTTLLAAARTHGFAVLFPRGKAGLCAWDPGVTEYLCWPTRQETVDVVGPRILAGWEASQTRAEAIAGVRFEQRYLFGFSNGGYFVAFLAVEGRYRVDGAGLVGAGRSAVDESLTGVERPPFYVAVGEQEGEVTRQNAAVLTAVLRRGGWRTAYVVHPGRGHEMHEDDLAGAWTHWGR